MGIPTYVDIQNMTLQKEFLSPDILDDNFLRQFILHFDMQTILFSNRVVAKDRFATGPTTFGRVITTIICIAAAVTIYVNWYIYVKLYRPWPDLHLISTLGMALKEVSYFCHIIKVRFFDYDDAIKLLIKLQEIDRIMEIHKTKTMQHITRKAAIESLAVFTLISLFYIVGSFYSEESVLTLFYLCAVWTFSTFWLELSLCSVISVNFLSRTRYLNALLRTQIKPLEATEEKVAGWLKGWQWLKSKFSSSRLSDVAMDRLVAENGHSFETSNADAQLRELLKGFELYGKAYQFQLLLQVTVGIVWMIVTFQSIIVAYKLEIPPINVAGFLIELCLDVLRITQVITKVDTFFKDIKKTRDLVLTILTTHFDGPIHKKAKQMLYTLQDIPPRFSVYDIFDLDAHFMLQLFNIATTSLVTLLQIAFL